MTNDVDIIQYNPSYFEKAVQLTNRTMVYWSHLKSHNHFYRSKISEVLQGVGISNLFYCAIKDEELLGYLCLHTQSTLPFKTSIPSNLFVYSLVAKDNDPKIIKQLIDKLIDISKNGNYSQVLLASGPAWGSQFEVLNDSPFMKITDIKYDLELDLSISIQLDDSYNVDSAQNLNYNEIEQILTNLSIGKREKDIFLFRVKFLDDYKLLKVVKDDEIIGIGLGYINSSKVIIYEIAVLQFLERKLVIENIIRKFISMANKSELKRLTIPIEFKEKFKENLIERGFNQIPTLNQHILPSSI